MVILNSPPQTREFIAFEFSFCRNRSYNCQLSWLTGHIQEKKEIGLVTENVCHINSLLIRSYNFYRNLSCFIYKVQEYIMFYLVDKHVYTWNWIIKYVWLKIDCPTNLYDQYCCLSLCSLTWKFPKKKTFCRAHKNLQLHFFYLKSFSYLV